MRTERRDELDRMLSRYWIGCFYEGLALGVAFDDRIKEIEAQKAELPKENLPKR